MFVKNAFKTAFLISASLIGAGFASGKEIIEFFYSPFGLFGAAVSTVCISGAVYVILKLNSRVYETYLYKWGTCLFLVCILSVMIAGSAEVLSYGRYIMSAAVLLTLMFGIRGVENVSMLLCPAMILFILLFGIEAVLNNYNSEVLPSGMPSPFLYAGYNILSFPVLLKNSKAKPVATALIVGVVMLPLIVVVYLASLITPYDSMPFLNATGGGGFSVFMLLSAMYTTAVCSAFCLKDMTGGKNISSFVCVAIALLCSFTGFGKLISSGYRTFGFAGIVMMAYMICDYVNCKKNREIRRIIKKTRVNSTNFTKFRN